MTLAAGVGRALRASLARPAFATPFAEAVAAADPRTLGDLADAAGRHGIPGYVLSAASEAGCATAIPLQQLEELRNDALFVHLRALADLRDLAALLDDERVPWLVVKGPVLAEAVHARPDLRSYGDLDVLVPPGRFAGALRTLEAGGCTVLDHDWARLRRDFKGEVRVRLPSGTVADLHWHLLNDRAVRDAFRMRTADLFARARFVEVGGTAVRTLDEVDTVVYLALHTMLSGAHRLIWLKDIEQAIERGRVTAGQLAGRAQEMGAALVVATAVDRVRCAIGLPEGMQSLTAGRLPERVWAGACRLVWRSRPAEREDGSGSSARLVARSGRSTATASAAALVRKSLAHARERDGLRVRPDGREANGPVSGSSSRTVQGAERRAYLEAVAREE